MSLPDRGARAGFAAPLAVVTMIAISLLALLTIEGALGEVRASAASYAEARVAVSAESALSEVLKARLDTAAASLPQGATVFLATLAGPDSVVARVEVVAPRLARLVIAARSRNPGIRVFAGIRGFLVLDSSASAPGEVLLRPLGPNWWVASP